MTPEPVRAGEVPPAERARELLALLDELDGCGLVVTDTTLLTKHVSAHFGAEPEDVDPDYSAADATEDDEEAE